MFCTQCGAKQEEATVKAGRPFSCACGARLQPPKKPFPVWLVFVLVGVPVSCLLLGAVAVIVPGFVTYRGRAKQVECKVNLKSLYTAQKAHFAELDSYSSSLEKVGFSPERGNRYAYYAAPDGPVEDRSGDTLRRPDGATGVSVDTRRHPNAQATPPIPTTVTGGLALGVSGRCPECQFTAACVGNLDEDADLDIWSISTADRRDPDGQPIPRGTPFNEVSDL